MTINDADLQKLVKEYSAPRDEYGGESYITRRRDWFDKPMEQIRPLLDRKRLNSLTLAEAARIYSDMAVGGPRLYPKTYIENGLDKIKASLVYLLYSDDPLDVRFTNFASNPESEYRLNGVGRAFASTALFLVDFHNYGIWNSAVDGGLRVLSMLPKRKPQLGETYVQIVNVLKQLQATCGFDDLSVTDEFVELIYHEKIGLSVFKTPEKTVEKAAEVEDTSVQTVAEEATHLRIQYLLVKIGQMRGHDVWVASNDRGKSYDSEAFASMTLDSLPQFAGSVTMQTAKAIDVIWFKKRTAQPLCFFEIEHTTSMYSGLLRLNDVKTDYPIPAAYIVAPKERRSMFDNQIARRTFAQSELGEVCQFLDYEKVEALLKSHTAIMNILP
ncbi:MAG: hypothetical protein JXB85_11775 [Anaerolineales bacterium]|nr:hypothetical protein [Anaerolineales bacterium]